MTCIILEREVLWAQLASQEKLQEVKGGFTILFRLNDIICEETCILMEYIIEENCDGKKKDDRRSRQQNHTILNIIKMDGSTSSRGSPITFGPLSYCLKILMLYYFLFASYIICIAVCPERPPGNPIAVFSCLVD